MKKLIILLFGLIVISCSSGSGNKDNNEKSEKEEIEIIVTNEFTKFIDDLWNDEDYNPVKFKVEQEKFKGKWAVLSGEIDWMTEFGSVQLIIKHNEKEFFVREINANFDFDNPEDIIDFRTGQEIKLKGKYIEGKEDKGIEIDYLYSKYTFHFKNPQVIEIKTNKL